MAAQDPSASSPTDTKFRRADFRHDVPLRENDDDQPIAHASFPLPPGGRELEMQPTSSTPYDRYFGSVRAVISSLKSVGGSPPIQHC
ncbi:MAG: hypothetical protein WDN28_01910 [Chthoniobacter sp.]